MRVIDAGISGIPLAQGELSWGGMGLDERWQGVLNILTPGQGLRPLQARALQEKELLKSRQNLLVSAPTNSGKSLVGLLVLLQAIGLGRRALLLEPLRALAREKVDELQELAVPLSRAMGMKLSVRISTGDYRMEDELPFAPPAGGELLVATPERMEALLRNPGNQPWLETVGAVCVDEAHLISSPRRGPTLECLITSLLCLPTPPRLVLLSATLGDVGRAQDWLAPCTLLKMEQRQPPLEKWVLELEAEEDANEVVMSWVEQYLQDPIAQVLIFVYQTRSAELLAALLQEKIGCVALAYHAQMSQRRKEFARQAYIAGKARVLVTTTALAMGINLPASHVLIRDSTFPGVGVVSVPELLQMMGRAGRGDRAGVAAVLVRAKEGRRAEELATALRAEELPELVSAFWGRHERVKEAMPPATTQVASLLSRWQEKGASLEQLRLYFERSLGGQELGGQVALALEWLERRVFAYRDPEQHFHLTVLGQKATRAVLPLPIAAGYAQLLRDLMSLDPKDDLLAQWRSLDHLLVLDLLSERPPSLRRYSARLVEQVERWCEGHSPQVPLLFWKWIVGKVGHSRVLEVLGSLGLKPNQGKQEEWGHRLGYLAMFRSVVMFERSQGIGIELVERRFGVEGLEGVEERWRDEVLWLLAGLSKILDIRTFYYHLKEACQADLERVKRVKGLLGKMRFQVYELLEQVKYCSPLGALLCEMRRVGKSGKQKVGIGAIQRLEDAGISSWKEIADLDVEQLVELGVSQRSAEQIQAYLLRRRS